MANYSSRESEYMKKTLEIEEKYSKLIRLNKAINLANVVIGSVLIFLSISGPSEFSSNNIQKAEISINYEKKNKENDKSFMVGLAGLCIVGAGFGLKKLLDKEIKIRKEDEEREVWRTFNLEEENNYF